MKKKIIVLLILTAVLLCSCGSDNVSILDQGRYDIRDGADDISDRLDNVFPVIENAVMKDEIEEQTTVFDDSVVYSIGDYKISSRMYYYIISTQKKMRVSTSQDDDYYGDDTKEFWDSYYAMTDMTQKEYVMTKAVDEHCRTILSCMCLFDEYGLKVSENIELTRQNILSQYGSKENFNKAYEKYGIEFEDYLLYYKYVDCYYALYDYLYGDDGISKYSDKELKAYFDENYVRFRHILFSFNETGDEGYSERLDEETIKEKTDKANAIFDRIQKGERTFESYVYMSEDEEGSTAGFLVTHGDLISGLDSVVFEMEAGDIRMAESRLGLHIVKKDVASETDFETYKENVMYAISGEDFKQRQSKYESQIKTDEKAKNMYDFYKVI